MDKSILIFGDSKIIWVWHNDVLSWHESVILDWLYSVVDVMGFLVESYAGKKYMTDCVDMKGIFRDDKIYKVENADSFDMLPGDLCGSSDESFFVEVYYG